MLRRADTDIKPNFEFFRGDVDEDKKVTPNIYTGIKTNIRLDIFSSNSIIAKDINSYCYFLYKKGNEKIYSSISSISKDSIGRRRVSFIYKFPSVYNLYKYTAYWNIMICYSYNYGIKDTVSYCFKKIPNNFDIDLVDSLEYK